jgi:hypothetical protein
LDAIAASAINAKRGLTSMAEVGKEKEFIVSRLRDIVFLAENTDPVEGDWEGYAKQCLRIIAEQAREAQKALALMQG